MSNMSYLLLTSLFSLIGMAFFIYGKKTTQFAYLGTGSLLMIYPFFITGTILITVIGVLLTAAPFVIRRYES